MDKIKPKFHVGDVVTNISGLYPNISPTISEVNIENQCYRYKEIGGITWFKEQDKLKLVDIKPIFKVGDKVKGVSSEEPEKEFIINVVNTDINCYHYFSGNGIITVFKDQHKLKLVNVDNSKPPVEDKAVSLSIDATITRQNVQIYNHNNYKQFALIDKFINEHSKMGYNSYTATFLTNVIHHDKNGKILVLSDLVDRIVNHYNSLGFRVNVNKDDNNYKVLIEW